MKNLVNNILFALIALALVETLLVLTWKYSRQRLKRIIDERTRELKDSRKDLQNTVQLLQKRELELNVANKALEQLASQDGLTELANRRIFDEYIRRVWSLQSRTGTPLSLIMCDIDYFKRYNDRYGHQAGDESLKLVAKGLRGSVKRSTDLVARYGGEEFVVVLPETDTDDAHVVAGRIQRTIRRLRIPHADSDTADTVTLSIGISSMVPDHKLSPEALIKNADIGLYQAKQNGRNRIVYFDDIQERHS